MRRPSQNAVRSAALGTCMVVLMAFGFSCGMAVMGIYGPTGFQKFTTVCNYEHGQVQGKVCIVGDRVFKVNVP